MINDIHIDKTLTIGVRIYVKKNKRGKHTGTYVRIQKKKKKKKSREGCFRCPPLAEFGVDGARFFADYIMGVCGTAERPRGDRWRSGAVGRPLGKYTETDIVGNSHLDVTTITTEGY